VTNAHPVEFRRATAADAESIVGFWTASGASMGPSDTVEGVRAAIRHPSAIFLLAIDGEGTVGTLLGTFDGWRGNLYRLVVRLDRRRQGIARRLVREMERRFADWGVRRVTVLVEADRPWAVAFWTAVGYPRDHRIVRHVGELPAMHGEYGHAPQS
jgi:GNAT superfamily N-acetyltransferase